MVKEVYANLEEKMKKTIDATRKEFATIRTGRATPALLDRIMVDYYGTPTPVNQVAKIAVPEPRTLLIQPWDKSTISLIEKAILKSDLGLTPNNDGVAIRLALPQLTREKRADLVKLVKKRAEDGKVAIRNIRRDGNEEVKSLEKKKLITEDEVKKAQDDIQKLTDKYIKEVDALVEAKEKEIMEV